MTFSILVCEGAQDQVALVWLARKCGGWAPDTNAPISVRDHFEIASSTIPGKPREAKRTDPRYLRKDARLLVVQGFGGDKEVLRKQTASFLKLPKLDAIGVFVDANDTGVEKRRESFRTTYRDAFSHADLAEAGRAWGDGPRLGLWVAPDNARKGSMADALVTAAKHARRELLEVGETFVESAQPKNPEGAWAEYRSKALLGAVYQGVAPGASLASALEKAHCWFDESLKDVSPFKELLTFIDELTTP